MPSHLRCGDGLKPRVLLKRVAALRRNLDWPHPVERHHRRRQPLQQRGNLVEFSAIASRDHQRDFMSGGCFCQGAIAPTFQVKNSQMTSRAGSQNRASCNIEPDPYATSKREENRRCQRLKTTRFPIGFPCAPDPCAQGNKAHRPLDPGYSRSPIALRDGADARSRETRIVFDPCAAAQNCDPRDTEHAIRRAVSE